MMQPSVSARIAAFARAYHQQHDQPLVFRDPLAHRLFSREELSAFEANLARSLAFFDAKAAALQSDAESALRHVMRNHIAPITLARSRYAEDALEQSVKQGTRQYVLLGAGFDTLAFRRPEWAANLGCSNWTTPPLRTRRNVASPMQGVLFQAIASGCP